MCARFIKSSQIQPTPPLVQVKLFIGCCFRCRVHRNDSHNYDHNFLTSILFILCCNCNLYACDIFDQIYDFYCFSCRLLIECVKIIKSSFALKNWKACLYFRGASGLESWCILKTYIFARHFYSIFNQEYSENCASFINAINSLSLKYLQQVAIQTFLLSKLFDLQIKY